MSYKFVVHGEIPDGTLLLFMHLLMEFGEVVGTDNCKFHVTRPGVPKEDAQHRLHGLMPLDVTLRGPLTPLTPEEQARLDEAMRKGLVKISKEH